MGSAAEEVDVEMVDGLAAVAAGVEHHAVAIGEALFAGDLGRGPEEVAQQRLIALISIRERIDVLARHHEHVDRRLRVNVREGIAELVLVDGGGRNGSFNDLAEEAAHGVTSVQECRRGDSLASRREPERPESGSRCGHGEHGHADSRIMFAY